MAVIAESATWEGSVYEIEITDPVEGGPAGKSNRAAQQLANRTKYLRQHSLLSETALPSYAGGDLFFATGAATLNRLAIGAASRVLTSTGSAPQWADSLALGGQVRGGSLRAATGDVIAQPTNLQDRFALSILGEGYVPLAAGSVSNLASVGFSGIVLARETSLSWQGVALYLVNHDTDQCSLLGSHGTGTTWGAAAGAAQLNVYVSGGLVKVQNNTADVRNPTFMVLRVG